MTKTDILSLFSLCDFDSPLTAEDADYAILSYLPRSFKYSYEIGASKLVIIPKEEKFVIKIPFAGYYTDDFNSKINKWYSFYQPNIHSCSDKHFNWDYCAGEVLLYRKAVKSKINKAFCKISYIGSINNYPIYIQRKAVTCTKHTSPRAYSPISNYNFCDTAWQASILDCYGQKFYTKLFEFIDDNAIDDLHKENIGYINDKPVLIDFNSYNC